MSKLVVVNCLSSKITFTEDGWINATQTAKNFNKDVRGYTRSEQYKGYLKRVLATKKYKLEDLILTRQGNSANTGTYINEIFKDHFLNWLIKPNKDISIQHIYILKAGGYIKIGITKDIKARLKKLQTGNPFKLEVFFISDLISNSFEIESFLLNKYKSKSMEGEWLNISEKELDNCINYINSNKK